MEVISKTDLSVFNSSEFGEVRVVEKDNDPWFVVKDVCDCLGLGNTTDASRRVEEEDKSTFSITKGGMPHVIVNESGLYTLILLSRKPEAKRFKKWVTSEVLPSIRKHGAYMTEDTLERTLQDPDYMIGLITNLKMERERNRVLETKIVEDTPKVNWANALLTSHKSILVGEMAKILKQNGIEIGQNRFFEWLRENGYLIKRRGADYNMPTQYSMELGLFEIKETVICHNSGHTTASFTSKITPKGQQYFVNLFLGNKGAAA